MDDKVSTVMLTFNQEDYISQSIESVLKQTYKNIEIVILDDGSKDNTYKILQVYRDKFKNIKLISHPGHVNMGITKSLNEALKHTTGKFISVCGGDDLYFPYTVEEQIKAFSNSKIDNLAFVSGTSIKIDRENKILAGINGTNLLEHKNPFESILQFFRISIITSFFEKEIFKKIGYFNEKLIYSDWEMIVRIASTHNFDFINKPLTKYRIHNINTCIDQPFEVEIDRTKLVIESLMNHSKTDSGKLGNKRSKCILNLKLAFINFLENDKIKSSELIRSSIVNLEEENILTDYAEWISNLKYNNYRLSYAIYIDYLIFHFYLLSGLIPQMYFDEILKIFIRFESYYHRKNNTSKLFFKLLKELKANINLKFSLSVLKNSFRNSLNLIK